MAIYHRPMGKLAAPELHKLVTALHANPPATHSLRDDPVVAGTPLVALQERWARQVRLSLDPEPATRPTPLIVRVFESGHEVDAILEDWGGMRLVPYQRGRPL